MSDKKILVQKICPNNGKTFETSDVSITLVILSFIEHIYGYFLTYFGDTFPIIEHYYGIRSLVLYNDILF